MDTSNVLFDGARVVRYDKRAPTPDMHYIDYGLGLLTSDVLTCENSNSHSISPTSTRRWQQRAAWRNTATRRFTRSARHAASPSLIII